jgi:hypothetical protein
LGHAQCTHAISFAANFRIDSANERQMLAVYSQVLLTQLQRHLRQSIPTDLEKVVNNPDEQAAARELVRHVTMGFYAKLFDSWDTGKLEYKKLFVGNAKRERLENLFALIENSRPRLRNQAQLPWLVASKR